MQRFYTFCIYTYVTDTDFYEKNIIICGFDADIYCL